MPHTLSWCHFGNVLKCPLSANKVGTSIRKARIQQRTLYMPKVQEKTIFWKATCSGVWASASGCLQNQEGVPYILMRGCPKFQMEFLPFAHNSGAWTWNSRGSAPEPALDSQNPNSSSLLESEAEKSPEVKMFINTQGPKRKEPVTYEPTGEAAGSLLFSWCEWITSLILRDSEVSSAISCDNIYSAGKGGEKEPLKRISSFSYLDSVNKINHQ